VSAIPTASAPVPAVAPSISNNPPAAPATIPTNLTQAQIRTIRLDEYLGRIADSATPYATIPPSPFDNPDGVSTKAYVWRLSAMNPRAMPGIGAGHYPDMSNVPANLSGVWINGLHENATENKSASGRARYAADLKRVKEAGWSPVKTAACPYWCGRELYPPTGAGMWWAWHIAGGQQNVQSPMYLPPKDSSKPQYMTDNGAKLSGWIRLPLDNAEYARQFTWTMVDGFLCVTGAKDIPEILYSAAADSIGDFSQMVGIIAAGFTGGIALATFGFNFVVDKLGLLSAVPGGNDVLKMAEKYADLT
jgi:hypothetical protein